MGISETVVHFVLYEGVKARLVAARAGGPGSDQRSPRDFLEFMAAGAFSKTVASCIAYPHGNLLLKRLFFTIYLQLTIQLDNVPSNTEHRWSIVEKGMGDFPCQCYVRH
jgi:hypothetical protein